MERKHNQGWNASESGVTILELLVAVLILAMILLSVPTSFRSSTQIWDKGDRHAEVLQNALIGMEEMARQLRQAKEITAYEPNGSITFTRDDATSGKFELPAGGDYLEIDTQLLSGPIDSLTFTLYDENGNPGTIDNDIRAVQIDMNTFDNQGKVNDIPLSSLVYIRDWTEYRADEFAIFGYGGVDIRAGKQGAVDGNVGTNGVADLGNNLDIDGKVVYLDELIQGDNPSQPTYDSASIGYTLMPEPTDFSGFSPGGENITVPDAGTRLLESGPYDDPAPYGDLVLGDNATLELESGAYYFQSITAGNNLSLVINLETGGDIRVFIEGQVKIGTQITGSFTKIVGGGTPNQVYFETHFSDPKPKEAAWEMKPNATWLGTIYAPYDDIGTENSGIADIILYGCLYSGGWVYISNNPFVVYMPSDYLLSRPYTYAP